MRRRGMRARLLYFVDRALRSSFGVQMASLALFTVLALFIGCLLARLAGLQGDASETFWWTWLRFTDPGYLGEDSGWGLRLASVAITLSGWVIFGLLISIFSNAVQERLARLRQGAQAVMAREHTIVLGWDSTVFSILDQLWSSDEGDPPSAVVVLADRDKDEMEQSIRRYCLVQRSRKTVCRSGSIQSTVSLRNVGLAEAKQVLIVGEGLTRAEQVVDSTVLKAVLACSQVLSESAAHLPLVTVVAAIQNAITRQLVRPFLDDRTDRMDLILVETSNILARIIAQCAWQPGLSLVYRDLLTYTGDLALSEDMRSSEIYCLTAKEAGLPPGTTFSQALFAFERANPIGYQLEQHAPLLNPLTVAGAADVPLAPSDHLFLVADRKQDIVFSDGRREVRRLSGEDALDKRRRILLLGTSSKARTVLEELRSYLHADSLLAATCLTTDETDLGGQTRRVVCDLNAILEGELERQQYDTVVLLEDATDPDQHDAKILTLMAAIRAAGRNSGSRPLVVAELYDPRNRELALAADVDDVVVSTELASNFMVQVAREPERAAIYRELMDEQGNEFYVRPVSTYCSDSHQQISFLDIMAKAAERKELAIGYLPPGAVRAELSPLDRRAKRPAREYHQIVVIAEA